MGVTYIGQTDFLPISYPLVSQPDWGAQEMSIKYRGAATKLEAFLASLSQGAAALDSGFSSFKLATWSPDDDPIYPTVTLNYVNSDSTKFPADRLETDWATQTAQKTGADTSDYTDLRRDVTYYAPVRTCSYITSTEQLTPRYSSSGTTGTTIIHSVITCKDSNGDDVTFYDNAPSDVLAELAFTEGDRTVAHKSSPVGSPVCDVWTNEDVVQRVLE